MTNEVINLTTYYYKKSEIDTLLNGKVDTSDSRLTDSRAPKSHSHGDITNTGTIGTDANKPLITTTDGKITTGSFGTTPNTFCQGNDSRLRDARAPLPHFHSKGEITDLTIPTKVSELTNDSGYLTSHQDISGKADKTGGVAQVTDANANNYSNIGSLSSGATQQAINNAINTALGEKQESGSYANAAQVINGESTQIDNGTLVYGKSDGNYYKIAANGTLDIRYPIFWLGAAVNSGSPTTNIYSTYANVDITTTISEKSLTASKMCYLEGTLNENIFTISSKVFVSDDALENNKYYIALGYMTNATNLRFTNNDRTIYIRTSNKLIPVGHTTPTKTSQLINDSNFVTNQSITDRVISVNTNNFSRQSWIQMLAGVYNYNLTSDPSSITREQYETLIGREVKYDEIAESVFYASLSSSFSNSEQSFLVSFEIETFEGTTRRYLVYKYSGKNSNYSIFPANIPKEDTANKTTQISQASTDTEYPSALAVYNALQDVGGGLSEEDLLGAEQIISNYNNYYKSLICIQLTNNDERKALNLRVNEDDGYYTYIPNKENYDGAPSILWNNDKCYIGITNDLPSQYYNIYLTTDSADYYPNSSYNPETDTSYLIISINFEDNQYLFKTAPSDEEVIKDITSNMIVVQYDVITTFDNRQDDAAE